MMTTSRLDRSLGFASLGGAAAALLVTLSWAALGGCSALFPSGGGGNPSASGPVQTTWVVHAVRVDTVGYLPGGEKIATVVPPAGTTIPAGSSAEVFTAELLVEQN